MPRLIESPTVVAAVGNKPKRIEEFAGRVNSGDESVSVRVERMPGDGFTQPALVALLGQDAVALYRDTTDRRRLGRAFVGREGAWKPVTPIDVSQWNAVLRSAAGYHAFRRVHPRGMRPANVAGFLLFDTEFPRSVRVCVRHIDRLSGELESGYALRRRRADVDPFDKLHAALESRRIDEVLRDGLHEFLDWIQCQLGAFTDELGRSFFGHDETAGSRAG